MNTVSNFDVLKRMSAENKDIRMATGHNILTLNKVKAGTKVTFGVEGDVVGRIFNGDLSACLILFDAAQFKAMKEQMESEVEE